MVSDCSASKSMRFSASAQGLELQEFATTGFFAPFPLGGQSYLDHWDGELTDLITSLSLRVRALFSLGSSGASCGTSLHWRRCDKRKWPFCTHLSFFLGRIAWCCKC